MDLFKSNSVTKNRFIVHITCTAVFRPPYLRLVHCTRQKTEHPYNTERGCNRIYIDDTLLLQHYDSVMISERSYRVPALHGCLPFIAPSFYGYFGTTTLIVTKIKWSTIRIISNRVLNGSCAFKYWSNDVNLITIFDLMRRKCSLITKNVCSSPTVFLYFIHYTFYSARKY